MTDATITERPILIIDDDEDAHFLLKRDLRKLGVTAKTDSVFGGEPGVAYFARCMKGEAAWPALVFLDVKMPDMNGFELLTWLRDHQLLGAISLVMLTSSDDPKDVQRAMSLGAHSYLTKPPPPAVLAEVVRTSLKLASVGGALPTPVVAPPKTTKKTILIVDDSGFARRVTRRALESLGFGVEEATSGEEAIERCAVRPPALVMLDLVMGGIDGLEVLTKLRAMHSNLRVIVLSADTQVSTRENAIKRGAHAFVNKPINDEKIASVIQSVLEISPWS